MSSHKKPGYRKTHLFARSLDEVVKLATKPMLDKQGKLYSALLANWPAIVGPQRAKMTRPGRLQFSSKEASGATLHLDVHPASASQMPYLHEQILEQCARYFGYRAITRLVCHPAYDMAKPDTTKPDIARPTTTKPEHAPPAPATPPGDLSEVLQRMRQRIMSDSTKK